MLGPHSLGKSAVLVGRVRDALRQRSLELGRTEQDTPQETAMV